MAKSNAPTISAAWQSDGNIQLSVDGVGPNGFNPPLKMQIARWNQYDGLYGSEADIASGGYIGASPGTTTPGRLYRWRARVRHANNSSDWSNWTESNFVQTTPTAPSGAVAVLSGPTAISVTWQNTVNTPWDNYTTEVWWNINGGGWGQLAVHGPGVASHYLDGLTPGATYQFLVKHRGQVAPNLPSADSNVTATLLALRVSDAPSGLIATRVNDNTTNLSWTNHASVGAPYDSLTVQRWDNESGNWDTVANVGGGNATLTDTGPIPGKYYQWRIAANNSVGSSGWVYSGNVFNTPSQPSSASAAYTGGTSVTASWVHAGYGDIDYRVQTYKNGVADGAVIALAGDARSYIKTGVDVLATYFFRVWAVSDVGALASPQSQSNSVSPAAAPNAPSGLSPSALVVDLARPYSINWVHSPSIDGSAQTKRQIRHKVQGAGSWTEDGVATTSAMSAVSPFSGYTNGQVIEWQVRTYGVHANPSPYSASSILQTSTTPTVNITSPGATVVNSEIPIGWSYFDAEGTAQAEYKIELFESVTGKIIATDNAALAISSLTLPTTTVDGSTYRLTVSVRDGSGLWSDLATHTFLAAFTPPAEVLLDVELDGLSGAGVLTLTPTADDGGVTTYPASSVTIERQFWDYETEAFGPWETLVENAPPETVLIDTTAPAHDDGQYRVTTHSAAPSSFESNTIHKPAVIDHRWLYVSGGEQFDVICKMWANIEISQTASRARALHYFAGRRNPVIYSGESTERTYSITGILEDEASDPNQWIRLGRMPGAVLLRAPGRRMYGNLSAVSIDRIQQGLHKVSFSIQEVSL